MALGHRILVPLDGSAFAERALSIATTVARHAGGTVQLVRVFDEFHEMEISLTPDDLMVEARKAVEARAREYLASIVNALGEAGVSADAEVRTGLPDLEILDAAGALEADMIAMATHGRGGFDRAWLGSIADRVIRHAEVPILLVSRHQKRHLEEEESPATRWAPPDIRTVIIPLDGSELARNALVPATALGDAFGADYILFRSIPRHPLPYPYATGGLPPAASNLGEEHLADARRELEEDAARLREAGYSVTVQIVKGDTPTEGLLGLAREPGAVIAMATHGRGGLRRALLGSVADKVIRRAPCPVLLVRPDQA